ANLEDTARITARSRHGQMPPLSPIHAAILPRSSGRLRVARGMRRGRRPRERPRVLTDESMWDPVPSGGDHPRPLTFGPARASFHRKGGFPMNASRVRMALGALSLSAAMVAAQPVWAATHHHTHHHHHHHCPSKKHKKTHHHHAKPAPKPS